MIKFPVENLSPGQVLAKDVVRGDGVTLLAAGRALTEDDIRLLQKLDVDSVALEGSAFVSEEERAAFLLNLKRDLDYRFSRVEADEILMEVKDMLLKRLERGTLTITSTRERLSPESLSDNPNGSRTRDGA